MGKLSGHFPNLLPSVRILDISRVLAGPLAAQLLGDLGASVIKIEHPQQPDETRGWGPPYWHDLSAYYLACNRNKRSLTLDLASSQGAEIFTKLLPQVDVVIENFRSDSSTKLHLTPSELHKVNSRLIICSISGFGRSGPLSQTSGYDFAIQALSGLMQVTGPIDGEPHKVGVAVTDVITGLYASSAILACLHAREKSGHGYAIDMALLDCAVAAQVNLAQSFLVTGQEPPRQGNAHWQIVPYRLFQTQDGYLVVAVGNDEQWQKLCQAITREDLAIDPKYKTNASRVKMRTELEPLLAAIFLREATIIWEQRLTEKNIPHARVQNYTEVFHDERLAGRRLAFQITDPNGKSVELLGCPIKINGSDTHSPTFPPRHGEQTAEILKELLRFDETEIAKLRAQGVV